MNLTTDLQALVREEPPYLLRPDDVVRDGRRLRRRRGLVSTCLAVTAAAACAAGLVALSPGPGPSQARDVVLPADGAATSPAQPVGAIERAVRAATPAAWTFDHVDAHDPASFQADVDDGAGPGRLHVGMSPSPGSMQQHPCRDREFAGDAVCTELPLGESRLVRRELSASGPVRTVAVVIVNPDGSGVYVEADNAVWPFVDLAPGAVVTPEQKRAMSTPKVTRDRPLYSTDQLVRIARAVEATR